MRKQYNNCDLIAKANVEKGCDGCNGKHIDANGSVVLHEKGCREAWRDEMIMCPECRKDFYRKKDSQQRVCDECQSFHDYYWNR